MVDAQSLAHPTDRALLASAGRTAEPAFAAIVRRHGGVLYAVAYRALESVPEAEEIVQDAFLLLWRKRARVQLAGDSALPWLIVSVKHLAANRRRSLRRRGRHESPDADLSRVPAPDESGDVGDLLRRGWKLGEVTPHDFYPQTSHVEIVSVLSR